MGKGGLIPAVRQERKSFASYPDPSVGVKIYLKQNQRGWSCFMEQLWINFHTNKEEVGEGEKTFEAR